MLIGVYLQIYTATYLSRIMERISACNIGIFEYRCCFCTGWFFELSDSNMNQWPNSFNSFWKGINLIFSPRFFSIFWHSPPQRSLIRSLRLYFQCIDCGSRYFGPLARILGRYTSIINDFGYNGWGIGIWKNRNILTFEPRHYKNILTFEPRHYNRFMV